MKNNVYMHWDSVHKLIQHYVDKRNTLVFMKQYFPLLCEMLADISDILHLKKNICYPLNWFNGLIMVHGLLASSVRIPRDQPQVGLY